MSNATYAFPTVFRETLPNVFEMDGGGIADTPGLWRRRRTEIMELLQRVCYGRMPPAPGNSPEVRRITPPNQVAGAEGAARSQFLTYPFADSDFGIPFDVYMPAGWNGGKLPVMLCGDGCWTRVTPALVELVVSRGYALAVFNRCIAVPDHSKTSKVEPLLPSPIERGSVLERRCRDLDFGAVAGWAWCYGRVLDALAFIDSVDIGRVAVSGHSRGGKASLLAGAFDERVAVVCTNGSGAGGSGSWLCLGENAETLAVITDAFPTWFRKGFGDYAGKMETLPFDQHFLKALCAPRPLLATEALGDKWANPPGACLTHAAAREVYRMLGAPDAHAAMHFREGEHDHSLVDWSAALDFCDYAYDGKPVKWDPLAVPYGEMPEPYAKSPKSKNGGSL